MSGYHPINAHVGLRMRQRRSLLGMSQTGLGQAVGLTFQQIQKYERGANRMSASRLFEFAAVLDVPVSYFFDEMSGSAAKTTTVRHRAWQENGVAAPADLNGDPLIKRETLQLVRAYYKIRVGSIRKRILRLVQSAEALGQERAPAKRKRR